MPEPIAPMIAPVSQGLVSELFAERNQKRAKDMADYNQALAIDLWKKTNYGAQAREMQKAGLNIGLMYKGAGQGGTVAQGTGQPATAQPPDMGMGLNYKLAAQQTEANTEKAKAEANLANTQAEAIKGTPGTKGEAEIKKTQQETTNLQTQNEIQQLDKKLKDIEAYLKSMTYDEALEKIRAEAQQASNQARKSDAEAKVAQETTDATIAEIKGRVIEQTVRIAAQKQGIKLSQGQLDTLALQMKTIAADRLQSWEKLNLMERETIAKEVLAGAAKQNADFQSSTPQQIRQWLGIITDLAGAAADGAKAIK